MSWYYAENNDRRGPIEDAQFDALVAQGVVRPETLVWRDGFDNWVPLATSGYRAGGAAAAATTEGSGSSTEVRPGEEMGVCSESGRILPRSELVEINGRLVSAEYKHVVLQRLREGVGATGAAADPEALGLMIEQRGYDFSIGSCIGQGWSLVKSHFWLSVGAIFLTTLISQAAGFIPLIGPLIVFGPITAGLYWLMLLFVRNEPASIGDAFMGFSKNFGQYLGLTAVFFLGVILCFVPGGIAFGIGAATSSGSAGPGALGAVGILLLFAGGLGMMYLWVSWIFSFLLIADKQIDFWPAMKLSKRVVGLHWWKIFGLIFLTGLVVMGVMICLLLIGAIPVALMAGLGSGRGLLVGVGVILACLFIPVLLGLMALSYATVAVAYEEIFGNTQRR